jgi:hypothetical protein
METSTPQWQRGELNPIVAAPGLPKPVAKLIERHTAVFFQWQAARRAAAVAAADVQRIRNADRLDAAAAVADGRELPPPDELRRAERAVEETKRAERAHADALVDIERRIRSAVGEHAARWLPALDSELSALGSAMESALKQLDAALRRRAELLAVRSVVARPEGKWLNAGAVGSTEYLLVERIREQIRGQAPLPGGLHERFDTSGGQHFDVSYSPEEKQLLGA